MNSLQVIFLNSQFPGQLVKLLFVVTGQLSSLSQIFVQFLQGDFVVHALALKYLDFLEDSVGFLGRQSQLGDSVGKISFRLLGLFLHQHNSTGKSRNISLDFLEALLPFFQCKVDLTLEEREKSFKEVEGDISALSRRIMLMEEEAKKSETNLADTV